jgi:hypothetical protein
MISSKVKAHTDLTNLRAAIVYNQQKRRSKGLLKVGSHRGATSRENAGLGPCFSLEMDGETFNAEAADKASFRTKDPNP